MEPVSSVVEHVTRVSDAAQRSLHPSGEQICDGSRAKHPDTAGSGGTGQSVAAFDVLSTPPPEPPPSSQLALKRSRLVKTTAK